MPSFPDKSARDLRAGRPYPTPTDARIAVVVNDDAPSASCINLLVAQAGVVVTTDELLKEVLPHVEVLFVWPFLLPSLQREWQRASSLRWIHAATAGVDGVLFRELTESSVQVTNSRGIFDDSIAEYVLGLLLAFAKDLPHTLELQRRHEWNHRDTERLFERRVLVLGAGPIGRAIARLTQQVHMTVELMGQRAREDAEFGSILGRADFHRALRRADFVVIAAPLTETTRGMFDRAAFSAMSPHARLINIGRGPIIDESELLAAIRDDRLAGAALDVFSEEPLPDNHPFWSEERIIVSPHMSADFLGWQEAVTDLFLQNLRRYGEGEPLLNLVEKRHGHGG